MSQTAVGSIPGAALVAEEVPDFERLVGSAGWRRLKGQIRERFSEKPWPGQPVRYIGVMYAVHASLLGLLLAQACRLIGTPFAPHRGKCVPVAIRLLHGGASSIVWEREYRYPWRDPILVRSTKVSTPDGLLECIGHGLGMKLAVFERDGALHFLSRYYFWRLGALTLRLPHWLGPGIAHVVHTDLGGGWFRFTMDFRHRLFGTLFHQDGVFQRDGSR